MPHAEDSLKRVNQKLKALVQEEKRMVKLFRIGNINEESVQQEIEDIQQKQATFQQEKREIEANRRAIASLDDAESQIAQVCAAVEENLETADYQRKRQALDALATNVVASSDSAVLFGHLPSYVTIARTSACLIAATYTYPAGTEAFSILAK